MDEDQKRNYLTITITMLGALKVISQSLGYDIINDELVNAVTNIVAGALTVIGVWMVHRKKTVKQEDI